MTEIVLSAILYKRHPPPTTIGNGKMSHNSLQFDILREQSRQNLRDILWENSVRPFRIYRDEFAQLSSVALQYL
jgi:hypothetical protein